MEAQDHQQWLDNVLAENLAQKPHEHDWEPDYGGCPECGQTDGGLNIGRDHRFVCHAHRVKWWVGNNLFSDWHEQTEEMWDAIAEKLEGYREIDHALSYCTICGVKAGEHTDGAGTEPAERR